MGRAIRPAVPQRQPDLALTGLVQPLLGQGRPQRIATHPLQPIALAGSDHQSGVHIEPGGVGVTRSQRRRRDVIQRVAAFADAGARSRPECHPPVDGRGGHRRQDWCLVRPRIGGLAVLGAAREPAPLDGTPGHIRAFDVNTGKLRWIFHTIPQPGEFAYDTWPADAYTLIGGANAWAGVTVDPTLGMVFAATGSASFDFYGVNRHGDNLFANCVLALDARTGKRIWHFQGVRHDVWDWDFPAAPTLVSVTRGGRSVAAVAQITKQGFVYVLDRRTGESLFPLEDRPVPPSAVEGERLSATQPFPVKPPPFTRQGLTESMLTTRTAEAHAAVVKRFREFGTGMYAPPTERGIIVFPGFDGGAEWGGAAFDPDSALLYVNSNEMPWIVRLIPNNDTSLYNVNCATCHREDRKGSPAAPSLIGVGERRTREEMAALIREGTGRMPAFPDMGARNIADLVEFLVTGRDKGADPTVTADPSWLKYRIDGETLFRDPDGYPPITPPWGTLNAIDLNAGAIKWQIPLGEYPELAAKGLKNTGSDNYGGPLVTAGGIVFIGATNFDRKFHAYDKATGKLLWETTLPAAGNATPATYTINGRQFVAIVCGGGKNGAPSGSSIVAFALR
jgi:quinoprotein glucose dehydrogenase